MDSAKNGMRIIPFKKFGRLRVNVKVNNVCINFIYLVKVLVFQMEINFLSRCPEMGAKLNIKVLFFCII